MQLTDSIAEKEKIIRSIQQFFEEQMDEEIGDLKAQLILEFFAKELAPLAYNKGIRDAETFLGNSIEDLKATCFIEPFKYRNKRKI